MTSNATSTAGSGPPLVVQTLGELLATPPAPREFLLAPWMLEGDSSLIYAPTGAGKSIFTLALALTIAGGGSLLGWNAPAPRRVLLVDGEMPLADIHERASMLLPSIQDCDAEAVRENLRFLVQQAQHADTAFPDMDKPAGQAAVLDSLADRLRQRGRRKVGARRPRRGPGLNHHGGEDGCLQNPGRTGEEARDDGRRTE